MKFLVFCLGLTIGQVSGAKVIEKIVAVVNDQIITQSDVAAYKTKLESGGLVDDLLFRVKEPSQLVKDPKALVDHMIDEKLIDSEVKKKNMSVTMERVEQEIRSITQRMRTDLNQLKQALAAKGLSFADYQDFIKTSLERKSLVDREVGSKIKISDEEVVAYYLAHNSGADARRGSGQVYEYTLAQITFRSARGGDRAAKSRADNVKGKLEDGAAFEKLVAQYTEDPDFTEGGLLGSFRMGEMNKDIEKALKGLEAGQVSPVVKLGANYHIFKVVKKTFVTDPNIEKQKDKILNLLFAQDYKAQFQTWLEQLRRDAFIRINAT